MAQLNPHFDCTVDHEAKYVLAVVGGRDVQEVHDCYRTLVEMALKHSYERILVVGQGTDDPYSHLAARDAVIAMHQIGVPAGFKIAFVPRVGSALNGHKHAEIEAQQRGMRAKVFSAVEHAVQWLTEPDLH